MKKRLPPDASDYLQIPPRKALSAEFDLLEGYELKKRGRYQVRFLGNESINGLPDSQVLEIELS